MRLAPPTKIPSTFSISKISLSIIRGQRHLYSKHKLNNSMNIKTIQSYRRYNLALHYLGKNQYKKRALKIAIDWENELLVSKKNNANLDPKVPKGSLESKWESHKSNINLVSPSNKRLLD